MEGRELERRLELGRLLDFYGPLITEHRREIVRMYCEEDMSLAEIAQLGSLSRQGVWDILRRAEAALQSYEEKTGLIRRFMERRDEIAAILQRL